MNMRKTSLTALMIVIIAVIAACGKIEYKPVAINEETDRCAICNMAVKDDAHATQIITKDGQSLKFDDVGCMNEWTAKNGTDNVGAAFVRDYNSKQWIKYEKAYYAYDSNYKTPMAYGLLSFESKADAESFIKEQGAGKLMTAKDLETHSWEANHEMKQMHNHSHSNDDEHHDDEHNEGEHHDGHAEGESTKDSKSGH